MKNTRYTVNDCQLSKSFSALDINANDKFELFSFPKQFAKQIIATFMKAPA